jgi:epoxyqueuosine reductase
MSAERIPFPGLSLSPIFKKNGFATVGWVNFSEVQSEYFVHAERYRRWIDSNMHGEMEYLKRGLERRLNPRLVFQELEGVIVVLDRYPATPIGDGVNQPRYARYMHGTDYHQSLRSKLNKAMVELQTIIDEKVNYKICVDTSAVLERTWAELAGVGWIGKNTLLINTVDGSYTLIGVVFTNIKFLGINSRKADLCGNCTRCIEACPTNALSEHRLDATRCISYLTLEKRGDWIFNDKDEKKIRLAIKDWVAGCDLCQEACPFNYKRDKYDPFVSPAPTFQLNYSELQSETESQYQERVKNSSLNRVKFKDFRRNLDQVLKNRAL